MKKQFLVLGTSLLLSSFSLSALAGGVGVVDTKKIFETSKLFEVLGNAKKEVTKLEEDLKKETLYKSKLLEEARMNKATDDELRKMQESFQAELEKKRKDGQDLSEKKQKELEDMSNKLKTQVENAIKDVAKDKNLDVIVDKQAVLFGGNDVTEDVIKKIK
ncbi:MAG: OmpH family outer membrane protein [Cyanobacteriota bacterium]